MQPNTIKQAIPNNPLYYDYNYEILKFYPRYLTTDHNNSQIHKIYCLKFQMNTISADAQYVCLKKIAGYEKEIADF